MGQALAGIISLLSFFLKFRRQLKGEFPELPFPNREFPELDEDSYYDDACA